jgi:hypothetical protein
VHLRRAGCLHERFRGGTLHKTAEGERAGREELRRLQAKAQNAGPARP